MCITTASARTTADQEACRQGQAQTAGRSTAKGPTITKDVEIKLNPAPQSVRYARNFVREHFAKWGFPEAAENGSVITSELTTNAITAAPKTPLIVSVRVANGFPMVEVADSSPEPPMLEPSANHLAGRGRGLRIVEELSVVWDTYAIAGGKVVWAQLSPE